MGKSRPADERFWEKVDKSPDGCWVWTGNRTAPGRYGRFYPMGNSGVLAHVYAYQTIVGPIPDGLELDHLCFNPPCVNPAHLEPVTHAENMRRLAASRQTCKRGHPFSEKSGQRFCEVCAAEVKRRWQVRKSLDPTWHEHRRELARAVYQSRKDDPEFRAKNAAKANAAYHRRKAAR